jgi:hypothetical protein
MDDSPTASRKPYVDQIDRELVTSSHVLSVGFDLAFEELSGTFAIEFKDGTIYHYKGVPLQAWEDLRNAPSIGSAYYHLIKHKYSAEKMTGACPKCGNGPGIIGERCDSCGCDVYERECGEPHPVAAGIFCRSPRRHAEREHASGRGAVWTEGANV